MKLHKDIIHEVGAENPDMGIFTHDDCHRMLEAQRDEFNVVIDEMIVERKRMISHYEERYQLTDETVGLLETLKKKLQ